jgi:hypothetical protein
MVGAYLAVAVLAVLATLAVLAATKVPVVVTIAAATAASGLVILYGRLQLGYWDPFAYIAFVFCWFFAFVVSFALLGAGRLLKWPFFLSRGRPERNGPEGAL